MAANKTARVSAILEILKLHRGGLTRATIEIRLDKRGLETSTRKLQRYLRELQEKPLEKIIQVDTDDGVGYALALGADTFDLAAMSTPTAIALLMLLQEARGRLPPEVIRQFEAARPQAQAALKQSARRDGMCRWPERVGIAPRLHTLKSPKIKDGVLERVHQALLNDKQLEIDYLPRSGAQTHYAITVLGLVDQYPGLVLIASKIGKPRPFTLNVDRIQKAHVLAEDAAHPPGFSLDEHIRSGALHQLMDGPPTLRVRLRAKLSWARIWIDSALGEQQKVTDAGGDWRYVTVTVQNTFAFRAYLKGFGADIEIIEPASLREEFAREAEQVLLRYRAPMPRKSLRVTLKAPTPGSFSEKVDTLPELSRQ